MLATLLGRLPDAEEHFRSTVEWTERAEARPWLATTRIEYARMLLRRADSGDRERALVQINAALELAHEVGMQEVVQDAISLKLAAQEVDSGEITKSIMVVATRVDEHRPDFSPYSAPDGTVTLMFSDMEDYTGMLERLGDIAAHEVVQAHNAIVRERTAAHRGHEVELRGDGFLLAFASARQAVLCAIDLQRAFATRNAEQAEHPIQIRIGLHTGETIKDADKFFGKSVVQAFRVADLARGDEILISSLTRELVQTAGDLSFDDGREVKLKGLAGTHRVHAVRWT